ncbi:MAG: hypothetical protein A3H96_13515 [Acidobacteria bacterium RIFCSPLOWO2_02_FULL_67_36]|nr:MAG: hypothetical protein A3H96_13515 [Acidobacteria bacterium RIFCSPLOWO2_02_FULL_67_36]OFW25645.1 MAG: hypothetical protein A3G21_10000 [Acidobacteria bacterium RIFCSPLOWO2_12_FULL_66_21]
MLTAAFVLAAAVALGAQEAKPAPAKEAPPKPAMVPLKVQLVLSRYQGEKKISSVPYALWVIANDPDNRGTNVRMGNKIPVTSTVFTSGGAPTTSYNYQDVGTNIDCRASTTPEAGYRVSLTVTDTSVYFPGRNERPATGSTNVAVPAFRNFTSNFYVLLRDGQSGQYLSATDPITGEVLKLDVTLNVLK